MLSKQDTFAKKKQRRIRFAVTMQTISQQWAQPPTHLEGPNERQLTVRQVQWVRRKLEAQVSDLRLLHVDKIKVFMKKKKKTIQQ